MTERTLNERYELETIIGHGGMAEVWRGYDRRLGRDVAVKVLRSDLATDEVFVERLRREARSVARLNHPNIVAIYDAGGDSVEGVLLPYLVMEFVPGRPLSYLLGEERLTTERAVEVVSAVLEALEFSHRAGFVHRDVKPGNIMLTDDGGVKVMDFGIARAIAATSAELTRTAQVLGTARYLSPEQATGGVVDGRSDVYSTGCLLYELLAGVPPYVAESAVGVIGMHVQADVPLARDADWDVPEALSSVAARAMAKDPADRFQTASEMGAALAAAFGGAAVPVPAAAPAAVVARRRGPVLLYGLAAAGVVAAIAGGSYLLTDRTAPASDPRPARTAPSDPDQPGGGAPGQSGGEGGEVGQVDDDDGSGNNRPPGPRPGSSSGVTPGGTPPPGAPAPTDPAPGPSNPGDPEPTPGESRDPSPGPSDSAVPSPSPTGSESPSPSPTPSPSDSPSPSPEPSDTASPEPTDPTPTEPTNSSSPEPTSTSSSAPSRDA